MERQRAHFGACRSALQVAVLADGSHMQEDRLLLRRKDFKALTHEGR